MQASPICKVWVSKLLKIEFLLVGIVHVKLFFGPEMCVRNLRNVRQDSIR